MNIRISVALYNTCFAYFSLRESLRPHLVAQADRGAKLVHVLFMASHIVRGGEWKILHEIVQEGESSEPRNSAPDLLTEYSFVGVWHTNHRAGRQDTGRIFSVCPSFSSRMFYWVEELRTPLIVSCSQGNLHWFRLFLD